MRTRTKGKEQERERSLDVDLDPLEMDRRFRVDFDDNGGPREDLGRSETFMGRETGGRGVY